MKPKPPKAGSKEWYAYYSARIDELAFSMDLQFIEASNAKDLWEEAVGKHRSPLPLAVDCLYICAKLSGNRVSIKAMKRLTKELWGKTITILPLDKRRDERRWVWSFQSFIMEMYPDQIAWDDFTEAWIDKVVDESYFKEDEE